MCDSKQLTLNAVRVLFLDERTRRYKLLRAVDFRSRMKHTVSKITLSVYVLLFCSSKFELLFYKDKSSGSFDHNQQMKASMIFKETQPLTLIFSRRH